MSGPLPDRLAADARQHPRTRVLRRGVLLEDSGRDSASCLILDVSPGGARVQIVKGELPRGTVTLVDARTTDIYQAAVVWRRGVYAGLAFHSVARVTEPEAPAPAAEQPALRVLVVDDDEANRLVLERVLTRLSADVSFAVDGLAAVETFETGEFDLVLMDLSMPVMDGYEAIARIRSLEATRAARRVPILVVSCHDQETEISRAARAGADDHVVKPINPASLLDNIRRRTGAAREAVAA